jgi:hypothetical protein
MPKVSQLLRQGPFSQGIDPWAEQGQYFHQLHGQMIGAILSQITEPLMARGYRLGREASLQIAEQTIPDIFIKDAHAQKDNAWDYPQAVGAAAIEIGLALKPTSPELDALYVREGKTGQLVTILEIISPSNKSDSDEMQHYKMRRKRLRDQAVHIVEVDLTRSVKRLIDGKMVHEYPYHIAIHLYDQYPRFLPMTLGDAPKTFALPLRADFIAVDLNTAYRQAYEAIAIAWHILEETGYSSDKLPFPSLLKDEERKPLFDAIEVWKRALKDAEQ